MVDTSSELDGLMRDLSIEISSTFGIEAKVRPSLRDSYDIAIQIFNGQPSATRTQKIQAMVRAKDNTVRVEVINSRTNNRTLEAA